ncbi:hypothetical protein ABZP36_016210 [Zizania latifolia]
MSSLSFPTTTAPAELQHGPWRGPALQPRRSPVATVRCAFSRDQYSGGALVGESMAETNYEAPAGWAAWEKRYYPAYVADVSGLVGALQLPATAHGHPSRRRHRRLGALLLASVPVSTVAALHHMALAAESILLL